MILLDEKLIRKPKRFECNSVEINIYEPIDYQDAIKSNHKQNWLKAIQEDFNSINSNQTWDIVPCPEGVRPYDTKWVFELKTNSAGVVSRFEARLCALGYMQQCSCSQCWANSYFNSLK